VLNTVEGEVRCGQLRPRRAGDKARRTGIADRLGDEDALAELIEKLASVEDDGLAVFVGLDDLARLPSVVPADGQGPPPAVALVMLQAIAVGRHVSIGHLNDLPVKLDEVFSR
jgi:hypothetical protein